VFDSAPIRSLSFSHDGQWLATGSEDLRIDIVMTHTRRALNPLFIIIDIDVEIDVQWYIQ
jgi:WD40 repeat protein